MQITVFDATGKKKTPWSLDEKVLGKPNDSLLAQALRIYETNSHQGGSRVKTRGEVAGSTRKIYRQKGTGRARHGARYAPIFVGGGVAHGPTGLRAKNLNLPKKMRRHALRVALLTKVKDATIFGLADPDKSDGRTSTLANFLGSALSHPQKRVLIITDSVIPAFHRALSNLQRVSLKNAELVNAMDLVMADAVLLTKTSLDSLVARATNQLPAPTKEDKN